MVLLGWPPLPTSDRGVASPNGRSEPFAQLQPRDEPVRRAATRRRQVAPAARSRTPKRVSGSGTLNKRPASGSVSHFPRRCPLCLTFGTEVSRKVSSIDQHGIALRVGGDLVGVNIARAGENGPETLLRQPALGQFLRRQNETAVVAGGKAALDPEEIRNRSARY